MSQGKKGVKGRKEKKRVPGSSVEEMKEKNNCVEEMESLKPERNGPMLEESGGKNGRGSSGQVQG